MCLSGLSGKLKNVAISTNCLRVNKNRGVQLSALDVTLNIPSLEN